MRKRNRSDLRKLLGEKRERLRKLRFELAQAELSDNSQIQKTKKDIARILTILQITN